jgi:hypothetical protein
MYGQQPARAAHHAIDTFRASAYARAARRTVVGHDADGAQRMEILSKFPAVSFTAEA